MMWANAWHTKIGLIQTGWNWHNVAFYSRRHFGWENMRKEFGMPNSFQSKKVTLVHIFSVAGGYKRVCLRVLSI